MRVPRETIYEDHRGVFDLTPQWFVYYTPLFFQIALDDIHTPPLVTDWPDVLTLYLPGSMFDGAFQASTSNRLSGVQRKRLLQAAAELDAAGYTSREDGPGKGLEANLKTFLRANRRTDDRSPTI